MPIQFSCDHCGGVLSIARRKAYALIDCPKCGCKQVVPNESKSQENAAKQQAGASVHAAVATATATMPPKEHAKALKDMPLFERPDFENLLHPGAKKLTEKSLETKTTIVPEANGAVNSAKPSPPVIATGVELAHDPNRIVLKRSHLILVAILVLVLIFLSFGTGFMVARVLK